MNDPRWLRLAARVSARPAPTTLASVRARLARRDGGPAWVHWLARPATLFGSAALLVLSAVVGNSLLDSAVTPVDEAGSVVSALLGDDGSFGLALDRDTPAGLPRADSGQVSL